MSEFEYIPEDKKEQFQAIANKCQLLVWTALPATLDAADTAAHWILTAVVMQRASWLHLSGLPKELEARVEDLAFEGSKLFPDQTDESLHSLKDLRATF